MIKGRLLGFAGMTLGEEYFQGGVLNSKAVVFQIVLEEETEVWLETVNEDAHWKATGLPKIKLPEGMYRIVFEIQGGFFQMKEKFMILGAEVERPSVYEPKGWEFHVRKIEQ